MVKTCLNIGVDIKGHLVYICKLHMCYPFQILPTAQRLLDELLSSQQTAINTVCGAPGTLFICSMILPNVPRFSKKDNKLPVCYYT